MTQGSNELHFFYDAQNKPAVVVCNGVPYSYVKNLQGDIVAILDSSRNVVVSYVYDAWGRPISKTGSMASTLGTVQPFRYRGYVYDEETGLYYLRSRFYDVCKARFINPDVLMSGNLYSYCKNAPVGRGDVGGMKDYATIGAGVNLFELIHNQETILADVSAFLAEQQRILKAEIPYALKKSSDTEGYDCATFISEPLEVCSKQRINGKTRFIRCETGITSMLKNERECFLFIARLEDYSLDEIPEGALLLRSIGYNGFGSGHGATFARRISAHKLIINHAANEEDGILSKALMFDQLNNEYDYVAWPKGLGTTEKAPCRLTLPIRRHELFHPVAFMD